jgi:streptogramin lyase
MRTGTLLATAVCAIAFSACGGGGGSAPPARAGGGTPAPAPAYTTFAIPNTSGLRMVPVAGDPLWVAAGKAAGNDPAVAFASVFLNGIFVPGAGVSTFSGTLTGNGSGGGPVSYGLGANGAVYSGDSTPSNATPAFVRDEATGRTWPLAPQNCTRNCGSYWPITVVAGPDGATWVLTFTGMVRLNADGTTTVRPFLAPAIGVGGVAVGADGAFWVTEPGESTVERVPLSGANTAYPVSGNPTRITAGSDGALWFIDLTGTIGRITTAGQASAYVGATSGRFTEGDAIATGGDGAIWFTEANANTLGRLTPGGLLSHYAVPPAGTSPAGITSARDGTLWFLEQYGGGIVVVHATPASSSASVSFGGAAR